MFKFRPVTVFRADYYMAGQQSLIPPVSAEPQYCCDLRADRVVRTVTPRKVRKRKAWQVQQPLSRDLRKCCVVVMMWEHYNTPTQHYGSHIYIVVTCSLDTKVSSNVRSQLLTRIRSIHSYVLSVSYTVLPMPHTKNLPWIVR